MAGLRSTNVIDLTPHLAKRARSSGALTESYGGLSAVIPLPFGRGSRNSLPPLPPAA